MPKILFIGTHRLNRSPSQRFRFEQYLYLLEQHGINYEISPLLSEKDDLIYYSKGNYLKKIEILIKSFNKRNKDALRAYHYDIIFIQREAFVVGPAYFERLLKKTGKKIIFDFDDAIWLKNVSEANKRFAWIKFPSKISNIISLSDVVIAGNDYLANYASKYNSNIKVIPTTIDTNYHKRSITRERKNQVCIGWTGSHTTIQYLDYLIPTLKKIKRKYGDKIYFKIIGDSNFSNEELGIQGVKWNLSDEIDQLSEIDIGIMPLPENNWTLGKCGLKGLQYMALEIPTILSSVGENCKIITDGVNGFLAKSENEWIDKLSFLIESPDTRRDMGIKARKTVVDYYSVNSQKENYIRIFKELLK